MKNSRLHKPEKLSFLKISNLTSFSLSPHGENLVMKTEIFNEKGEKVPILGGLRDFRV